MESWFFRFLPLISLIHLLITSFLNYLPIFWLVHVEPSAPEKTGSCINTAA